jgi:uncharacterized protein (TIGR02268 family)
MASLRQGEQQARAEAQQCREEKARLLAEFSGQGGLTGLITNEWMGEKGVVARVLKDVTSRTAAPLEVRKVISYRAVGPDGRERVAVEVRLLNLGTVAWTPTGAALVRARREELTGLAVWPLEPIPPGELRRIVVELVVTENVARGTFSLDLWDQGGGHLITIDGVTFP